MKCPLQPIERYQGKQGVLVKAVDCLQDECAWWDGHGGFCAVLKIARHLAVSAINLAEIIEKMPE